MGTVAARSPASVQERFVRGYRRHRVDVLLVAVILLVAGPVVELMMAQQESRWALTAALVERGTVRLDAYEHILGVDRAVVGAHTYSDKAPGQPFLAAPFFALYRAVGGQPATIQHEIGNLGLWWVSFWSATLPAAGLAVLMRRLGQRVAGDAAAIAAALSLALGSLLLPFATVLFGHVLAAFFGLAAFLLAVPRDASPRRLFAAGLVTGLAVVTEFTLGIVAVLLVGVVAVRHGRRLVWLVAGGLGPALGLVAYNTVVFGGPFTFSYHHSANFTGHREGLVGVQPPDLVRLAQVLVGERGLFTLTPVVLAGVIGAGLLLRGTPRERFLGGAGLTVFAAFVLMMAGWGNATGGASPGPRYVVPALPFLAAGVARAYERWRWPTAVASGVGVVTMLLATLTLPLAQPTETFAVGHWVWRATQGRFADTLLTLLLGTDWALLVPLVPAAWIAARLLRRPEPGAV